MCHDIFWALAVLNEEVKRWSLKDHLESQQLRSFRDIRHFRLERSAMIVNGIISIYGRKRSIAKTPAKHSFSVTLYFAHHGFSFWEKNAMGLSPPSFSIWRSTAPTPKSKASHCTKTVFKSPGVVELMLLLAQLRFFRHFELPPAPRNFWWICDTIQLFLKTVELSSYFSAPACFWWLPLGAL